MKLFSVRLILKMTLPAPFSVTTVIQCIGVLLEKMAVAGVAVKSISGVKNNIMTQVKAPPTIANYFDTILHK